MTTDGTSALAVQPRAIVLSEENAIRTVKALENIVVGLRRDVLREGIHYGVIPGTGDKPCLWLPGMEVFMRALNAEPVYTIQEKIVDYDKPLFHYEYECRLVDVDTGQTVPGGRGLGLCHSMESSFAWRWVSESDVPSNLDKSTLLTRNSELVEPEFAIKKKETGGKYGKPLAYWEAFEQAMADGSARQVHRDKKGGGKMLCYAIGGLLYRIPNPDVFDQVNSIMKRAKKRALGDAVKGAANVSEHFTVDVEDFVRHDMPQLDNSDVIDADFSVVTDTPAQSKPAQQPAPANGMTDAQKLEELKRQITYALEGVVLREDEIAHLAGITNFHNMDEWRAIGSTAKAVKLVQENYDANVLASTSPAQPKNKAALDPADAELALWEWTRDTYDVTVKPHFNNLVKKLTKEGKLVDGMTLQQKQDVIAAHYAEKNGESKPSGMDAIEAHAAEEAAKGKDLSSKHDPDEPTHVEDYGERRQQEEEAALIERAAKDDVPF